MHLNCSNQTDLEQNRKRNWNHSFLWLKSLQHDVQLLTKMLLRKLTLLFDYKYNEKKLSSAFDAKHFFKINL